MQTRAASQPKQTNALPGVIDSIADGLSAALAFPLLMTLPLLLDAYYWLGWRLTPAALTSPIARWIDENSGEDGRETIETLGRLGRSDMTALVAQLTPALLPGVDRADVYEPWARPTAAIDAWWLVIPVLLGIVALGVGVFASYYVLLADAALGRPREWRALPGRIGRTWARFLGLLLLILGVFLLALGPFLVLTVISVIGGIGLGALVVPVMVIGGLAIAIFLIFTPEAIVVANVGPVRAMYLSFNVVRRNFWPTIGFLFASTLMTLGLSEIWGQLAATPPGLLTGVIAHAFFAGGFAMAGMIFFANRMKLLAASR